MATLIRVERNRQQGGIVSEKVSYFVSNVKPASQPQAVELFAAIRQHWCVEVMHHKRDVSLAEDSLRTGKADVSRLVGSLHMLIIKLLVKNMAAQLDTFADKFPTLIQFLTQQMVL